MRLGVVGGRLVWTAPRGVLTPELLEELRVRKEEVLALLDPTRPPDVTDARQLAAAWHGAARELSELAGYPRLPFKTACSVLPGAASWGTFIARASIPDLQLVVAALRDLIASMPRPGGEQ